MAKTRININQFAGMNRDADRSAIDDAEADFIMNWDLNPKNYLERRPGIEQVGANTYASVQTTPLIHYKQGSTIDRIIFKAGSELYYTDSDFTSDTKFSGAVNCTNCQWAVQYAGEVYFIFSNAAHYKYDGTTFSQETGTPHGTHAVVHKDRLFQIHTTATTTGNEAKVFYSDVGDFTGPGMSGNTIDVRSGDGDWLTKIVVYNDNLILFKTKSIWILYVEAADPADWELKSINGSLGAICRDSTLVYENLIYFQSLTGVYRTDGTTFEEISAPLRHDFIGRDIDQGESLKDCMTVMDKKLILHRDPGTTGLSAITWVFHLEIEGWTIYTYGDYDNFGISQFMRPTRFLQIDHFDFNNVIWGNKVTSSPASLYRFNDTASQDLDETYTCIYSSKVFSFGEFGSWKRMTRAGIDYRATGPISYTWRYAVGKDEPGTIAGTTSFGSDYYRTGEPMEVVGQFRSVALEITQEQNTLQGAIFGFWIEVEEMEPLGKQLN